MYGKLHNLIFEIGIEKVKIFSRFANRLEKRFITNCIRDKANAIFHLRFNKISRIIKCI